MRIVIVKQNGAFMVVKGKMLASTDDKSHVSIVTCEGCELDDLPLSVVSRITVDGEEVYKNINDDWTEACDDVEKRKEQ